MNLNQEKSSLKSLIDLIPCRNSGIECTGLSGSDRAFLVSKICVVGAGRWGKNHIKTLHELGCLAGIVEADAVTRVECGKNYPFLFPLRQLLNSTEAVGR
ncbi:MAG: hypothetical protein KAU60_07905 [Desulfobacterales bacterium]|nr:hypothetical protein [Desulfobacterales bacterium]